MTEPGSLTDAFVWREETAEDRAFLHKLFKLTKGGDFSGPGWDAVGRDSLLAWQFDAREQAYRHQYPLAQRWIFVHSNSTIGRMVLGGGTAAMHIVDIALLPDFQRRGIGTRILRTVLADACQRQVTVRLMVERGNPARRLYERLGFRAMASDGVYTSMELAVTLAAQK